MKLIKSVMAGCLVLTAAVVLGQRKTAQPVSHDSSSSQAAQAASLDHGQWVWDHNCSRCHDAPQGFSTHISGTIAKHMRERANLSDADYKALMRFLQQQ